MLVLYYMVNSNQDFVNACKTMRLEKKSNIISEKTFKTSIKISGDGYKTFSRNHYFNYSYIFSMWLGEKYM